MIIQHVLLAIFWLIFCFLHSFLALESIKHKSEKYFGRGVYRIVYNVFAVVTLLLLNWFQVKQTSPELFRPGTWLIYCAVIVTGIGITIMFICIRKYFVQLSGITESFKDELRTDGIHRYVRHPLYLGTFLFITGLFFIWPMLKNLLAVVVIIGYTLIGIGIEEKKLLVHFGDKYREYMQKVPRIFPFSR